LKQILYALAIHVEAVICFDRVHQGYNTVSILTVQGNAGGESLLSRDQSSSILPKSMTSSSGVKALNAEYGNT
jgi:hypothetical protein